MTRTELRAVLLSVQIHDFCTSTVSSITNRRVRETVVTSKGKAMIDLIDAARERIGRGIFERWDVQKMDELVRLMRKFADAVLSEQPVGS